MRPVLFALVSVCALGAALACFEASDDTRSGVPPKTLTASTSSVAVGVTPSAPIEPPLPIGPDLVQARTQAPSTPVGNAAAKQGQPLYERYCRLCHGERANGYAADNAPSLVSKSFLESATDEFIARGIAMGRPHTAMAAYSKERGGPLSEAEIAAIVAYIRSLGPAVVPRLEDMKLSGDATRGRPLYEAQCQKCHGTATERGNAVSLHNSELLAAATPGFLRYAIVQGRQGTPMLAFASMLSEQQIADIVSYLQTFAPKQAAPRVRTQVTNDMPVVIHPKGATPKFTHRAGRFARR